MGSLRPARRLGFAPLAIGLTLTLIHLISIPITNTSVNPARSTGPAIFAGKAYIEQLWFFWLAPISGAVIAGVVGGVLFRREFRLAITAAREAVSEGGFTIACCTRAHIPLRLS